MIEDSRRMKGILQMYDVDANIGFNAAEQELRERSKSAGRDHSTGARSERMVPSSPVVKSFGPLGVQGSLPVLRNELNDSFHT